MRVCKGGPGKNTTSKFFKGPNEPIIWPKASASSAHAQSWPVTQKGKPCNDQLRQKPTAVWKYISQKQQRNSRGFMHLLPFFSYQFAQGGDLEGGEFRKTAPCARITPLTTPGDYKTHWTMGRHAHSNLVKVTTLTKEKRPAHFFQTRPRSATWIRFLDQSLSRTSLPFYPKRKKRKACQLKVCEVTLVDIHNPYDRYTGCRAWERKLW